MGRVPQGWCLLLVAWSLLPGAAEAQVREPLPRFAVDLHAASVGLPTVEGWVPPVTPETPLPGRAWWLTTAVTGYPLRLGIVTLGVGAAFSTAQGASDPLEVVDGSGDEAPVTPIVRTRVTSVIPQLSVNFGHKLGWSYLSAGIGRTKVDSSADAVGTHPEIVVPAVWNQALNFGGGARWFMKRRFGAGFDVRFVKLGSRAESGAVGSARRTQMITFSAGITIQ